MQNWPHLELPRTLKSRWRSEGICVFIDDLEHGAHARDLNDGWVQSQTLVHLT